MKQIKNYDKALKEMVNEFCVRFYKEVYNEPYEE